MHWVRRSWDFKHREAWTISKSHGEMFFVNNIFYLHGYFAQA
jgi:hypothetical protein